MFFLFKSLGKNRLFVFFPVLRPLKTPRCLEATGWTVCRRRPGGVGASAAAAKFGGCQTTGGGFLVGFVEL